MHRFFFLSFLFLSYFSFLSLSQPVEPIFFKNSHVMTRAAQRESPLQNIASRRRKSGKPNPKTQHRLTASSTV